VAPGLRTLDQARPAITSYTEIDDLLEQRDEAAAVATSETALDAAGLSLRAVAVAHRAREQDEPVASCLRRAGTRRRSGSGPDG
jgi:hypothetical protein